MALAGKEFADSRLKPSLRRGQGQLFSDAQFATPPKGPGNLTMDEWIDTQQPVYHGSFRSDWRNAPVSHHGTIGQAVTRLDSVQHVLKGSTQGRDKYYDPSSVLEGDYDYDEDAAEPYMHTGKVYASRFTEPRSRVQLSDSAANAAEMGYRYENYEDEFEIPASVKESAGLDAPELTVDDKYHNPKAIHDSDMAEFGHRQLEQGIPITYRNAIEGRNPIDAVASSESYAAPSSSITSWERDVINEPTASPLAQQFAQQRIRQGNEGAVPFPSPTVTRQPEQKQLPIFFDENERAEGTAPNTTNRWMKYTGAVDRPSPAVRSTLQSIQFEA